VGKRVRGRGHSRIRPAGGVGGERRTMVSDARRPPRHGDDLPPREPPHTTLSCQSGLSYRVMCLAKLAFQEGGGGILESSGNRGGRARTHDRRVKLMNKQRKSPCLSSFACSPGSLGAGVDVMRRTGGGGASRPPPPYHRCIY
jgi:hypothetical protein